MLTAQEIKDISYYIIDKETTAESNPGSSMKDQASDAISTDGFIRGELITIQNILTSYLNEYKLTTGYTKDNYKKISTYYNYQGTNYSDTLIEELQEVYDGAMFLNNNDDAIFPVGNLFYHTTEDWDSKLSTDPTPNTNPDLRNNFPVSDTHYKYDSWWADASSKVYKPFYYRNEQEILNNLTDAINVYQNGISGNANVSFTEYAPVVRYSDGTVPHSVIDKNNNIVNMNTKSYMFQTSGYSCSYSNNQIALASDGTHYALVKLIEKKPTTNILAPYYFKYKELASSGTLSGTITFNFTLSTENASVQSLLIGLVNEWLNVLSVNSENVISSIGLNSERRAVDTIALDNATALVSVINTWLANPFKFAFFVFPAFITQVSNRISYLSTRISQITSYLSSTTYFNDRLNLINIRINKKDGSLMAVCDILRSGNSGKQIDESTQAYLNILKHKMVVKKFKQDGDGTLTFMSPIGDDENTYHFNVGDLVYLISDISSNNFIGSYIGTARIKSINETTVDEPSATEDTTSKTRVRIYKVNKIVSKKLLVQDRARAVRVLPPYNT